MTQSVQPAKRPQRPYRRTIFGRARGQFYRLPFFVRLAIPIVLLAGPVLFAIGYFAGNGFAVKVVNKLLYPNRGKDIDKAKAKFEEAARAENEEDMKAALREILVLDPNDQRARLGLVALETGEADPNDEKFARLTCEIHIRYNRWPEAEREARKYLVHNPNSWYARCVCAIAAVNRKDLATAKVEIEQMPDLSGVKEPIGPGMVNQAFKLYAIIDRDPTSLRNFVADRVVDFIRGPRVMAMPMPGKVVILECYLRGYDFNTTRPQPDGLGKAISSVGELCESATREAIEKKDAANLANLGYLCGRLADSYGLLLRDRTLAEDQYSVLIREIEERLDKIWIALREADPQAPGAYLGLAQAELRKKNVPKATEIVREGLKNCGGDQRDLLALQGQLLRAENDGGKAFRQTVDAAVRDPKNPDRWWQVVVAAISIGNLNDARNALEEIRKLTPNAPGIPRIEAFLALADKKYLPALQILNAMDKPTMAGDPELANWYVRAMIGSNTAAGLKDFFRLTEETGLKRNSPAAITAVIRGVSETPQYDAQASKEAIQISKRGLELWPDDPELLLAQAQAYYHAAENTEWELAATKAAIRAFEGLRNKNPKDADLVAEIVLLKLRGKEKDEGGALRTAGQLIELDKQNQPMTDRQLLALGSAYLANDKNVEAVAVLEKVLKQPPSPGSILALAKAYHKTGKFDDAKRAFNTVKEMMGRPTLPWSLTPQEQADYSSVAELVRS